MRCMTCVLILATALTGCGPSTRDTRTAAQIAAEQEARYQKERAAMTPQQLQQHDQIQAKIKADREKEAAKAK